MIQVYTGNGKGKTTAALGLALRAAGAGFRVYIAHFMKNRPSSERIALAKIKNINIACFGRSCFIKGAPSKKDIAPAQKGIEAVNKILKGGRYKLVILDEINTALKLKLLRLDQAMELIRIAPPKTEIVLTGRYAHPEIIKRAHLVSEIKEIKHYFKKGRKARRGIEY